MKLRNLLKKMGVICYMDKIKIHELAKELGVASKEIVSIANQLGANVKNHLSTIDEQMMEKIKNKFNNRGMNSKGMEKDKEKKSNIQEKKQEEKSPVIIRRAVIITDEVIKFIVVKEEE